MHQIVVSDSNQNVLTKQQQLFNKLIKSIESCKKDIEKESKKLDKILADYQEIVVPIKCQEIEEIFTLIKKLDDLSVKSKLTNKQSSLLKDIILYFFGELFYSQIATKEQEDLYNKWSEISYQDEQTEIIKEKKKELQKQMKTMTGIDIDVNEFGDDAEGEAKFYEEFARKMSEQQNDTKSKPNHTRKKTKAQIKKEEEERLFEEMKTKNLRSIYVGLAKLLHPDTEVDETLKIEKEDIMKKVTVAYENKDIATLLALEIEWVHKNNNNLHQLKDDVLKVYCKVLQEQIQELKQEKYLLSQHPRYESIKNTTFMGFGTTLVNVKQEHSKIARQIVKYKKNIILVESGLLGTIEIATILNKLDAEIEKENELNNPFDFMMNMY